MSAEKNALDDEAHWLYRYYDSAGDLLYVGISVDPLKRRDQHRAKSRWFSLVASMTAELTWSRSDALDAETEAIETELPMYNAMPKNVAVLPSRHNKRMGRPPVDKPITKTLGGVRVSDEQYKSYSDQAERDNKTVSNWIRNTLDKSALRARKDTT